MLSYLMLHLRMLFVSSSVMVSVLLALLLAWRAHAGMAARLLKELKPSVAVAAPAAVESAGAGRPLTVAIINQPTDHVLPPGVYSSIAIWNYEVARRLAGPCRTVVYCRELPGHTESALHEGVEYRRVPIRPDRVLVKLLRKTAWMRPARRPYLVSRFYYASYARHVAEDVKRLGADVVHVPNFPQFLPILRAKNPAIRIVLHMHCNWLCDFQPRMLERRLRDADLITTCSDYVTEQVKQVFPQYAARCRTMYNGVDGRGFERPAPPAPPALDQGGARLLYVGRVSPEKGVHVLLEAFTRVLEKVPQATLTVVGPDEVQPPDIYIRFSQDPKVRALRRFYDGHNYGQRLKQALPPAVAARVNFVGAAPHAKLPGYFAEADLFLFPSVWQEPFGISVIEAQAAGVPVVATRSGGVVESIVHGETGLLVERADARGMADAALLLLADAPLRAKLAGAARESVLQRFSWQHVRDGVLREYLAIQPREPEAAAMEQGRRRQWGDRVKT